MFPNPGQQTFRSLGLRFNIGLTPLHRCFMPVLTDDDAASPAVSLARGGDVVGTKDAAEMLRVSVATVQKMVERGELQAWRTEGGHRRIPLQSILKLTRGRSTAAPPARRSLQVLLVEPNASTARAVAKFLEEWGSAVELTLVESATDALVSMARHLPDLLVTELAMQPLDGFELIKSVRRSFDAPRLHILAVTALPDEDIQARGGLDRRVLCYRKPLALQRLAGFVDAQILALEEEPVAAPPAQG
jgi:excisionase family DNA binding protein